MTKDCTNNNDEKEEDEEREICMMTCQKYCYAGLVSAWYQYLFLSQKVLHWLRNKLGGGGGKGGARILHNSVLFSKSSIVLLQQPCIVIGTAFYRELYIENIVIGVGYSLTAYCGQVRDGTKLIQMVSTVWVNSSAVLSGKKCCSGHVECLISLYRVHYSCILIVHSYNLIIYSQLLSLNLNPCVTN